jgi:purine-binding chemotaxis protein CheW
MADIQTRAPEALRELISFRVAGHDFCTDIRQVCEIRGWTQLVPMPHAPEFVLGVINLRGTVMPVVDIAARLGLAATEPSERHVIMVVNIHQNWSGLLVEAVSETLTVPAAQIHKAPYVNSDQTRRFVEGFITTQDSMLTVVHLAHLIAQLDDALTHDLASSLMA